MVAPALLLLAAAAGAADLDAARKALHKSHGGQLLTKVAAERLEFQDDALVWDAYAWAGGDRNRVWLSSEGELEGSLHELELQIGYSRAISPFWDLQMGLRHDIDPNPSRTYAAVGLSGITPYWFHVEATAFVSEHGHVSARVELEYELRLGQRITLGPRVEAELGSAADDALALGPGLRQIEAGLRLHYEATRGFSPYVGVNWTRLFSGTADRALAAGERRSETSLVAGLQFWF